MGYGRRLGNLTSNQGENRMREYKQEHIWSKADDRWIFIEKKDGVLIGLNYMQGDDYESFKAHFAKNDEKLTQFANRMMHFKGEESFVEFINKVIWLYFELSIEGEKLA